MLPRNKIKCLPLIVIAIAPLVLIGFYTNPLEASASRMNYTNNYNYAEADSLKESSTNKKSNTLSSLYQETKEIYSNAEEFAPTYVSVMDDILLQSQSATHEEKMVAWMLSIAEDDTHGYCQFPDEKIGNTVSRGRDLDPDIDCSSFVYYALLNSGYTTAQLGDKPFTTYDMREILTNNGFVETRFRGTSKLKPGDILWREGHTEVYIGNKKNVGAHIAETGEINGRPGDQTGREVATKKTGMNWEFVLRAKEQ